jgi:serpin B
LPVVLNRLSVTSPKPERRTEAVLKILLPLFFLISGAAANAAALATDVASASNRFCLELYRQVGAEPGNLAFSPYSISSALAMTYAGARGRTEEEMATVLRLPFGQDTTHAAFASLRLRLIEMADASGCTLSVANRLWGQEGTPFLGPFLATTREAYGAELERLDFRGRGEDSRRRINEWTQEQTRGMIPDLLPPGSITGQTRLVLTNAIYLKASWEEPFRGRDTHDAPFHPSPAETLTVPMMHRTGRYLHAHPDGAQVLVMDYVGKRSSMVILLPDTIDGLVALEAGLDPGSLDRWIATAQEAEVDVALPKFRVASSLPLAGVLSGMGMPSAFRGGDADFSGMNGARDLFVSAVVHKAVVDVAEKGTEAAAATAAVMTLSSIDVPKDSAIRFVADRPFLFLIRDTSSSLILFIGRVVNPLL